MKFLFFVFLLITAVGFSQEICDNGIDDDGDGLIDLQDYDCHCGAGLFESELLNVIPNQNFDNTSCCPTTQPISISCLDNWHNSNPLWNIYAEFVNSCSTCDNGSANWDPIADIPPECYIPNSNGMLSVAYYGNTNLYTYNDFASVCLNSPLTSNYKYRVQFKSFRPYIYPKPGQDNINLGTVETGIFGTDDCTYVPMLNSGCVSNPYWTNLDNIYDSIPLDSEWHTYSYNFQPNGTITGLGFGPSCGAGSYVSGENKRTVQYFMDSLRLFYSPISVVTIRDTGSFCNQNLFLHASLDTNVVGNWQWYKDSIAIVGETNDSIDISALGIGHYTAVFSINGNCAGGTVYIPPSQFPDVLIVAPNEQCQNEDFNFVSSANVDPIYGNTVTNYKWDFGNGQLSFQKDTVYAYPNSGTYDAMVIAFTDDGCPDTAFQTIEIKDIPNTNFEFGNNCLNDSSRYVNLSTIPTGTITNILWEFDNNVMRTDSIEHIKYNMAGSYPVKLKTFSDFGCVDSMIINQVIHPLPVANFRGNDTCSGDLTLFTDLSSISSGAIDIYNWYSENILFSNNTSPSILYDNEGNYDVKLIVISDSGCVDSISKSIASHAIPQVNFSTITNCLQTNFSDLSVISNGLISDYLWDFGDGGTSILASPIHTFQTAGDFNTNLTLTSDFGCKNDTSILVQTTSSIDLEINASSLLICAGDCINFESSASLDGKNLIYDWTFTDGQQSDLPDPTMCFTKNTDNSLTVEVKLEASTLTGCIDSTKLSDFISVLTTPEADFSFFPNKIYRSEPEVQFENRSTLGTHYEWNFGDGQYSMDLSPVHLYPENAKKYTVSLKVLDETKTCSNSKTAIIDIIDEIIIYAPNAFTPDGSGINDSFKPIISAGIDIYSYKLEIFNRWGKLLFVSYDPSVGWDGYYGGDIIANDSYIWRMEFNETNTDKAHTKFGHFTVIK